MLLTVYVHFPAQEQRPEAQLCYALFADEKGFPDAPSLAEQSNCAPLKKAMSHPPESENSKLGVETLKLEFPNLLLSKKYALSVFLDENANKTLDTNFLGIPRESFGFSNNPLVRFSAPSFQQCSFALSDAPAQSFEIQLSSLGKRKLN